MKLDDVKAEVAGMPKHQQDHLAAYLVHLRHQRDAEIGREIAAKIEDKDAKNWISLDELKEQWKD